MNKHLLDEIKKRFHLDSDAQLCRKLMLHPPVVSKMRHELIPVGPAHIINIHEETGMSIAEIKLLLAQPAKGGGDADQRA